MISTVLILYEVALNKAETIYCHPQIEAITSGEIESRVLLN